MGWGRVAWRLQRFELVVLMGGCLALATVMAVVAWRLDWAMTQMQTCFRDAPATTAGVAPCHVFDESIMQLETAATILTGIGTVAPFLIGSFLGAPLVAREVERRTAALVRSLSPSRSAWLLGRVLPIAAAVMVALLILGQAAELAILASPPGGQIDFRHFAMHGPLIAVRGVTVLLIGVLVGLVIGRVLPAILVTGLLTIALVLGLYVVRDQFMRAEAIWMPVGADAGNFTTIYDQAWTDDATGALVTYDEAMQRFPEVFGPEGSWDPPGLTMVFLATPPELYPSFVAREIAVPVGVAALSVAGAAWVIGWRRPE